MGKTRLQLYPSSAGAVAETAINLTVLGAAVTLTTGATSIEGFIFFAQVGTTAPSAGTLLTIQGHQDASGNENEWFDLHTPIATGLTAAATTTKNDASTAAGATTITITGSGTFGARSKLLYFKDSTTAGEWILQQSHVTTTMTLPSPGTVLTHANGISIYDQAIRIPFLLDVTGVKRVRLVVDNNQQATGSTVAVYAVFTDYVP